MAVRAAYQAPAAGLDAAREALFGWAAALRARLADEAGDEWELTALAAGARFVSALDLVGEALRSRGVEIPAVPETCRVVLGLVGRLGQ